MKNLLIAFSLLLAGQVNAQYFQRTFGAAATFENNAQMVPSNDFFGGYVLAGNHIPAAAGSLQEVYVVRSDNNGATPAAPFFNNRYLMIDVGLAQPFSTLTTSVAEINVGAGIYEYAVAGVMFMPGAANYDVFVMKLNATGVPIWSFRYDFPNFGFKDPKIQIDLTNANILVTGRCFDYLNPANGQDIYAMSINSVTGGLNWFQSYDLTVGITSCNDGGTDIIDNPYTAGQCLVVGYSNADGLLLTLNSATGAVIGLPGTFVLPAGYLSGQLTSIRASGNPLTAAAFVVSGIATLPNINPATQNDAWTMLINQAGVVAWSTTHDNSVAPLLSNDANEIMERWNPFSGFYEYYTVGTLFTGGLASDVHVLKLNNFGTVMPVGEFIYGTAADNERGNSIRMSNTGGFTASASNSVALGEQMLINSYFNGVNACNYTTSTIPSPSTLPTPGIRGVVTFSSPNTDPITTNINTLGQTPICFAVVVGGGSNLKEVPVKSAKDDEGFNFTVLGSGEQGASTGSDIHIAVQNNLSGALTARITDLLGREYPCRINDEGNGQISLSSKISATGMYYILLSNGQEHKTKALFIK